VRVTPLAVNLYRADIWQMSLGPEVGIAWRP
jgi:hypothetical protein